MGFFFPFFPFFPFSLRFPFWCWIIVGRYEERVVAANPCSARGRTKLGRVHIGRYIGYNILPPPPNELEIKIRQY